MKTRFAALLLAPALLAGFSPAYAVQAEGPAPQKQVRVSEAATTILKLSKGQVSEPVIIAYIENARRNFELSADEIVYLKQEGVSDKVVSAALNHHASIPQAVVSVPQEPAVAQAPVAAQQPTVVYTQPQTTYVQAAPQPTYVYTYPSYYYDPFPVYYSYYPRYYYPYRYGYYGYRYPSVSFNFGFGHGYYGGYRGGYSGGFHGGYGGGFHGGYGGHVGTSFRSGSAHNIGFGGGRHR